MTTSESRGVVGGTPEPLHRRALIGGLVGAAGAAALAGLAKAGPLTPPAGAVASTGKTLTEVESRTAVSAANTPGNASAVFVIAQPGLYYLTGNVDVPAGKAGIVIAASDVTLDLNGFRINGGGSAGSRGITDFGTEWRNITIQNGTVEGAGDIGLFMLSNPLRVTDMTVKGCAGNGVLTGVRAFLERVTAVGNSTAGGTNPPPAGVVLGSESAVVDCTAASNTGAGFNVGARVLVSRCTALQNSGTGISVGPTGVVIGCAAAGNGGAGITTQHSGVVEGCAVEGNVGVGISCSFGSIVRNCDAGSNAGGGVTVWEGGLIAGCTAGGNTGVGYTMNTGCLISRCAATFNTTHGIHAGNGVGSSIFGCVARNNWITGIIAGARCYVRENNCEANSTLGPGAAGIQATGTSARVEGNVCASGLGYGVWVTASRVMVAGNGCAQNLTNWNISSNCIYGPVVDRTNPASSAMSGNGTVASTLGTSDPFANLSY